MKPNKNLLAMAVVFCLASSMVLTQEAHAQPAGYVSHQKVNTSYDFVYDQTTWADKAYNAQFALDQLTSMHASVHKITGCFNAIVCMHSLEVNQAYGLIK